jgi:hypothetical protein
MSPGGETGRRTTLRGWREIVRVRISSRTPQLLRIKKEFYKELFFIFDLMEQKNPGSRKKPRLFQLAAVISLTISAD